MGVGHLAIAVALAVGAWALLERRRQRRMETSLMGDPVAKVVVIGVALLGIAGGGYAVLSHPSATLDGERVTCERSSTYWMPGDPSRDVLDKDPACMGTGRVRTVVGMGLVVAGITVAAGFVADADKRQRDRWP